MPAPDFATDGRLSPSARLVGQYLQRIVRRCYTDCLCSAKTIARNLALSKRTVQAAIQALADLGLVEIVRDYGLRTRRRIRLLWRVAVGAATLAGAMAAPAPADGPTPNASVGADTGLECQLEFALTNPIPPDPPYKVSEDKTEERRTDEPGAGEPAFGHPAPGEGAVVVVSSPDPYRDPEDVPAEVIAQAEAVLGSGPGTVGRLKSAAAQWGLRSVRAAVKVVSDQARGGGVKDPLRYFFGTLKKMRVEGGPPEEAPRPGPKVPSPEERARLDEAIAAAERAAAERAAAEAAKARRWEDLTEERRQEIRSETRKRFPGLSDQARETMARARFAEEEGRGC